MTFGLVGNTTKPELRNVSRTLIAFLREKKCSFVVHEELAGWLTSEGGSLKLQESEIVSETDLPRRSDVIVALGGDGTMLAAARLVGKHGIPILGINLGKLGFLAEVSVDEIHECLGDVLAGRYVVEDRMVLEARRVNDGEVFFCLNDIVIDKGMSARVIDLETYVNDDYLVTYKADGLILTTPTGSTAYSLASGGPIVTPKSAVITINPISPHTLTARPVIVPDDSLLKIVVSTAAKRVHLTVDGQIEKLYDAPAEFLVRRASHTVKLIKRTTRTYFDVLRTKLLWGKDLRVGR